MTLLTLPLLRAAVKAQLVRDHEVTPVAIPEEAKTELHSLRRRLTLTVRHELVDLHWVGLELPAIDFDNAEILRTAVAWREAGCGLSLGETA